MCLRNVGPQFQRDFESRARASNISLTQPDDPQFLLRAGVVRLRIHHLFQIRAGLVKVSLPFSEQRQIVSRVIVLGIELQAAGELLM